MPTIVKDYSVVIIGSGVSGLFTALKIAEQGNQVLLLTKSSLSENNSRYAQGGIAAFLPENTEDSLELHIQDTLIAGAGLCEESAVRTILANGHEAIADLLTYGVPFDRDEHNQLAFTKEAAHSVRRILHAAGDATGQAVEMALIDRVDAHPNIEVMEFCQVLSLEVEQSNNEETGLNYENSTPANCAGCWAVSLKDQKTYYFQAPSVVLATGGIGRLYKHTTNPTIATGDGLALASRAGVALKGMEFIQFHPTALYLKGAVRFLISEAVRGEGGILKNKAGVAFSKKYHPHGELAPRDIVTRAIFSEMQAFKTDHVWLDVSHLPSDLLEKRFPTILKSCLQYGIDIRKHPIPVAPAAHYMMGGISVNVQGETSVKGLYVVGEAAYTGLHGANRLASNSLLECVVLARTVAHAILAQPRSLVRDPVYVKENLPAFFQPGISVNAPLPLSAQAALKNCTENLHKLMWQLVGIIRTAEGLETALQQIEIWEKNAFSSGWQRLIPEGFELVNQLHVARIIAQSALSRSNSIGAHYINLKALKPERFSTKTNRPVVEPFSEFSSDVLVVPVT